MTIVRSTTERPADFTTSQRHYFVLCVTNSEFLTASPLGLFVTLLFLPPQMQRHTSRWSPETSLFIFWFLFQSFWCVLTPFISVFSLVVLLHLHHVNLIDVMMMMMMMKLSYVVTRGDATVLAHLALTTIKFDNLITMIIIERFKVVWNERNHSKTT